MALKDKLRVFIDTNVIFSGLYSDHGAPAAVLEYHVRGDIRIIVSQLVLDEVILILRKKLPIGLLALQRLLVNSPPEVVRNPSLEQVERWTEVLSLGDSAILAAAVQAAPDHFVTGDNHFLKNPGLAKEAVLNIVTPAELVRIIEK
jgi:predicted nucleic acid-binding protein